MEALKKVDRETSGQFGLRKLAVEKFTFELPQAQLDVGTVSATIDDEACGFMISSHACHFLFREPTRLPRTPVASRRRHGGSADPGDVECISQAASLTYGTLPDRFPPYHANPGSRGGFRYRCCGLRLPSWAGSHRWMRGYG